MTNLVEDNHRQIYTILFSKKDMINEREYQKVKDSHVNNGIMLCKFFYIDIPDAERKTIQIIDVIQDIQWELKLLKFQRKRDVVNKWIGEKRDANRENCKKEMMERLKEIGVENALQLCFMHPVNFQNMFWKKIVSTIIWRAAGKWKHYLTGEDLFDLAKALWRDLHNDVRQELLEKAGIHDMQTLLAYWIKKFIKTFKRRMLLLFVEYEDYALEKHLIEFWEHLWWNWDLPSLIHKLLKEKWIKTAIDVLRSPRWKFRGLNTYIWEYLNRSIRDISQEERYLLCEKLGYSIPNEITEAIKQSMENGGSSYDAIKSFWFNDTIWIIYNFLPEITERLGYDPLQIIRDELKTQLKRKRWVSCHSTYMNNVTAKEISHFWLLRLWLLLGHSVRLFYSKEKAELWEVLWYAA